MALLFIIQYSRFFSLAVFKVLVLLSLTLLAASLCVAKTLTIDNNSVITEEIYFNWLVVLGFNATLTAEVIS